MKRYTSIPFPPYRHRPGATPHPERDPRGHSYGARPAPPSAEGFRGHEDYLYGVDLFNAGYWWEAHEAWERLWSLVPPESPEALFLQALIQLAAARLKLALGEKRGAERLAVRSREKLGKLRRVVHERRYMGLDLDEIEAVVDRFPSGLDEEIVLAPGA